MKMLFFIFEVEKSVRIVFEKKLLNSDMKGKRKCENGKSVYGQNKAKH